MPSRSSSRSRSSKVDAGLAQRVEVALRVGSTVAPPIFASRAAASSVGSGIVLTLSGPTSPSTYSVSG